jgi:hypothetical protein
MKLGRKAASQALLAAIPCRPALGIQPEALIVMYYDVIEDDS